MKVGYARVFTFEMDPITNAIVAAVSAGITEIGKKHLYDDCFGFIVYIINSFCTHVVALGIRPNICINAKPGNL